MGQITTDQSHQVMATLAANTRWGEIDFEVAGLQDRIIRNPQEAGRQFTEFLKKGAQIIAGILKTIKVGTGLKSADDFRTALKAAGCRIGNWANDILGKPAFTVASQAGDIDLVVFTTAQLTGNENGGTTKEVFAGAARLGLDKCLPEDGPQLRLQYLDQPLGEWLRIGMDPITDSDGELLVFHVDHDDDGLWLLTLCAHPGRRWFGGTRWVFRRRK